MGGIIVDALVTQQQQLATKLGGGGTLTKQNMLVTRNNVMQNILARHPEDDKSVLVLALMS